MSYQGWRVRHYVPIRSADDIADHELAVLPVVPLDWLHDGFARVSPTDYDRLKRFKIVPMAWMPTKTMVAVVDAIGYREARRKGLAIVGRILPEDFRAQVRLHFGQSLLKTATHHLRRTMPWASASSRVTAVQALAFCAVFLASAGFCSVVGPKTFALAVGLLSGLFFSMVIGLRMFCLMPPVKHAPSPKDMASNDNGLPVYTVLVPLFRESRVLQQLVHALSAINYPPELLDIKLILEETDPEMQRTVGALILPEQFDVIVVPAGFPQTKPRALNHAMAFARGSLVAIYDSEDIPEPDQLLKAARRFMAADDDVACLQAKLRFFNPTENWLAQQFSAEYAVLFDVILPCLAQFRLPILLGGTSNHFRVDHLQQVGGWDPFNVTEDADLGLRLARMGFRTQALDSITYEEANTRLGNWLRQRRRWLKGFLQTWLVHMRHPVQSLRELGFAGFCTMQCMTLGVFASALLHPVLVVIGVWCLLPWHMNGLSDDGFGSVLAGLDLFLLIAGYATAALAMTRALATAGLPGGLHLILTLPVYWILLSIAAWQSLVDFCVAPFHWHKTEHGLSWMTQTKAAPERQIPKRTRRANYL